MAKEKEWQFRIEEAQRRMEAEAKAREQVLEDNFQKRMRTQQERFQK